MEWSLQVNEMLTTQISKLNYTLLPPGFTGDVRHMRLVQRSLSKLIDVLGEESARDQELSKVITTGEKLKNSLDHILYVLADFEGNGGKGELIGMLKVSRKHLFLFDEKNIVREVNPWAVLDFFIRKDKQRLGYGKLLFDHMMQDLKITPQELAIDGPSSKMEQFFRKNYQVDHLFRQNNNFAISPEFFNIVPESMSSKSGRTTPVVPQQAVGRFTAAQPHSAIGDVIHGDIPHANAKRETTSGDATPELEGGAVAARDTAKGQPGSNDSIEPPQLEIKEQSEEEVKPDTEEQADLQKSPERPSTLHVEPVSGTPAPALSPATSTASRRDSQLTERGYFDVKFYHNKLW